MVGILRELASRTAEFGRAVRSHHAPSSTWDGEGFVREEVARRALAELLPADAVREMHEDLRRAATHDALDEIGVKP